MRQVAFFKKFIHPSARQHKFSLRIDSNERVSRAILHSRLAYGGLPFNFAKEPLKCSHGELRMNVIWIYIVNIMETISSGVSKVSFCICYHISGQLLCIISPWKLCQLQQSSLFYLVGGGSHLLKKATRFIEPHLKMSRFGPRSAFASSHRALRGRSI